MPLSLAVQFEQTVARETAALSQADPQLAAQPRPGRTWTMKQELGHLIDSAANNHQRFVRAAIDGVYRGPGYQQDEWVARHGYADMDWLDLVEFWRRYNLLLARVVERIPADRMETECVIGDGAPVTLRFRDRGLPGAHAVPPGSHPRARGRHAVPASGEGVTLSSPWDVRCGRRR